MNKLSTRTIALSSALAAFSAVAQLIHIGYQSPQWGMWIDIVAVSWIMAFFLFGVKSSLTVSLLGALIITLFAPDTWLGASMKWVATMPMWGGLFLLTILEKKSISEYRNIANIVLPTILGVVIRCLLVIPLNYYYAIPIWTGMTPTQAISAIPWFVIAGFNTVQGVLEVVLAWIIVFHFKLSRFATWKE